MRRGVRVAEVVSRVLITIGGMGTILAVTLIFAFLASVVLPLFLPAEVSAPHEVVEAGKDAAHAPLVHVACDDYRVMTAELFGDGHYEVRRIDDGSLVDQGSLLSDPGQEMTAFAAAPSGTEFVIGLSDGRLRHGTFGFEATFPEGTDLPAVTKDQRVTWGHGVLELTPEGKSRLQRFAPKLDDPLDPGLGGARPRLVDFGGDKSSLALVVLTDDGRLAFVQTGTKLDWMTGEETFTAEAHELPFDPAEGRGAPTHLLLTGQGDNVFVVWDDGWTNRIDVHDPSAPFLAEELDLVADPQAKISAIGFLLGRSTVLVGDTAGGLRAWFRSKPAGATTKDGTVTRAAHVLRAPAADGTGPVPLRLASSDRSRMAVCGYDDGSVRLYQVTTAKEIVVARAPGLDAVQQVRLAPKDDALLAWGDGKLAQWDLDPEHPEAGIAAFFAPVWYEGYPAPSNTWQSVSASEEFEPKYGFLPLVFGTLKATFYTMIFGAPLAILAAIYTSEFLDRRLRTVVKSTIEMMASLPSVVLGFLAALVIAPFAQRVIPATLAVFVTLPLSLLLGAYLWQLLPHRTAIRMSGWPRVVAMAVAVLGIGVPAAALAGPLVERVFFAGNMELWLDGQIGSGLGGWLMLTVPGAGLLVLLAGGRISSAWIRRRSASWSRGRMAGVDLGRFGLGLAAAAALALGTAWLLTTVGLDPRGSYVDTFEQRNALVVGFVMGFAVIPIIYTLAEDALSSVPESLRLASLGAGATQWQTAVRVIVPTAMSGLFSALMIGLGRAVGETMIVLMATGNTPIIDMNIFNGFRTLSANIAVELPEAVRDSTHYRALFMAALVLFAITFVLNTIAERVRQRFRKRAYQL